MLAICPGCSIELPLNSLVCPLCDSLCITPADEDGSQGAETCCLTARDYTILESAERNFTRNTIVGAALREKLSNARVMMTNDIPPDRITIGSRVLYTVDDGPTVSRVLAYSEDPYPVGMALILTSPQGIGLLGRTEGERFQIRRLDGRMERLGVERIAYQPERVRRATRMRPDNVLRFEAGCTVAPHDPDDGHSGPSAA